MSLTFYHYTNPQYCRPYGTRTHVPTLRGWWPTTSRMDGITGNIIAGQIWSLLLEISCCVFPYLLLVPNRTTTYGYSVSGCAFPCLHHWGTTGFHDFPMVALTWACALHRHCKSHAVAWFSRRIFLGAECLGWSTGLEPVPFVLQTIITNLIAGVSFII